MRLNSCTSKPIISRITHPGSKLELATYLRENHNKDISADAGLLSNNNIQALKENGYTFILGARIKNESLSIIKRIDKLVIIATGVFFINGA